MLFPGLLVPLIGLLPPRVGFLIFLTPAADLYRFDLDFLPFDDNRNSEAKFVVSDGWITPQYIEEVFAEVLFTGSKSISDIIAELFEIRIFQVRSIQLPVTGSAA